jgi:2Fe-2S ferredoxin
LAQVDGAAGESRLIQVTYIEDNGASHTIVVREGQSLMDAATKHRIPGIDGDCGGACACATCHVYVAPEWFERLVPMKELERQMLKFASLPKETSRLACQIVASPALNGLSVTIPISQY